MRLVAELLSEKPLFVILTCHAPEHFSSEDFAKILENLPQFVGKTAERLIIEMRDRLPETDDSDTTASDTSTHNPSQQQIEAEAVTALLALGYKPPQASRMVASISADNLSAEDMIRLALKASLS